MDPRGDGVGNEIDGLQATFGRGGRRVVSVRLIPI